MSLSPVAPAPDRGDLPVGPRAARTVPGGLSVEWPPPAAPHQGLGRVSGPGDADTVPKLNEQRHGFYLISLLTCKLEGDGLT